jgi:hypothetical protein
MDAAAAAAAAAAVQVRAPASLQGSSNFSSWCSFNSPLLLLQQQQQTPFGVGLEAFESATVAAAAGMPAAFRSLEPALTNYSTGSLTSNSIAPAPAPALNDFVLFCSGYEPGNAARLIRRISCSSRPTVAHKYWCYAAVQRR